MVVGMALLAVVGVSAGASAAGDRDESAGIVRAAAKSLRSRAPLWVSRPAAVVPGQLAHFVLDPTTAVDCTVSARQAGSARAAFAIRRREYGSPERVSFRVSAKAAAGLWRLRADCHQGLNVSKSASAAFRVKGNGGSTLDLVAGRVRVKRIARSTGGSPGSFGGAPAGKGSGCDMMGNPFTDCDANPTWKWCTWWAFHQRPDIWTTSHNNGAPYGGWDAFMWASYAARFGHFPTGTEPVVGAIAVFSREYFGGPNKDGGGGQYGHVAYVESVNPSNGTFVTSNHNWGGYGTPTTGVASRPIRYPGPSGGITFIYGGPAGNGPISQYVGHLVHWNAENKPQANKTAWLVVRKPDGSIRRNWVPDQATWNCLKTAGAPGPDELAAQVLDQMPDEIGVHATCQGRGGSPPPTTTTAPPPPTTTPPPPPPTTTSPSGPGVVTLTGGPSVTPNGGNPGTTVTYTFTIKNTGGSAVGIQVAFFAVRGPDGSNLDAWCNGGANFSLAAGASFACNASGTYNAPGTYTWWADWEDTSGGFHALSGNGTFNIAAPAPPPPSAGASKGPQHNVTGCSSVYCAYLTAWWSNFSGGNHTVVCYADYGGASSFYSYTVSGSSGSSNVCVFGWPGYHAWVTVDGVESNHVTW
jgi:surface antigen